jgi:hypothetical protein
VDNLPPPTKLGRRSRVPLRCTAAAAKRALAPKPGVSNFVGTDQPQTPSQMVPLPMPRGQFIPDDSTISDVVSTLKNPELFVRGVLENMYACRREYPGETITVSIGVVGKGIVPNYFIEHSEGPFPVFGIFNGRSHKTFVEEEDAKSSWSRKTMTLDEVAQLIGQLRKDKKSGRG